MLKELIVKWRQAVTGEGLRGMHNKKLSAREDELTALECKWAETPYIQLKDFLEPYDRQMKSKDIKSSYFTVLAGFINRMAGGNSPFFYPRPGTCKYPEQGMVIPGDCYVHIADIADHVRALDKKGLEDLAHAHTGALKEAVERAEPRKADDLLKSGFAFAGRSEAKAAFCMGAREFSGDFSLFLRYKTGSREHGFSID